jgi:type IV secretory pathway protease TraF
MTGRATTLLLTVGAAALALSTIAARPAKRYVWNASGSVPIGLYRLQPTTDLSVTQLVAVQPPEPLATFLADQRYLPRGVPMLKQRNALANPNQRKIRRDSSGFLQSLRESRRQRILPERCCTAT